MSPTLTRDRQVPRPKFAELRNRLDEYLIELRAGKSGSVAEARAEVLEACCRMAVRPRGLFSLTVPTGGGKTLSSLAFALKHAEQHACSRVIYAIPFTSIIEQTSVVFRKVFSSVPEETILEHHCNTDPGKETDTTRLVTQNWDAPIVVTTNVQLFESLYAARTSSCRKLHNICNSVIILDEAQSVPVELLKPTLAAIRELVQNYGCTVVLCTATQPAFDKSETFNIGLENPTEIISNPSLLFERLKRVRIRNLGPQSDEDIVQKLRKHRQFLCVVNTRAHAMNLFNRFVCDQNVESTSEQATAFRTNHGSDEAFHLSTFMCGEHRKKSLDHIRQRLRDGLPCHVISTQLIEAGVDVDFPVVYRSLSGIDSMAQAAGRCNREGQLDCGEVFLFEPTEVKLRGYLKATADSSSELIADLDRNDMDLLNQDIVRRYFDLNFWRHKELWDARNVMACFPSPYQKAQFDFRTAAERFRWIEESAETVFIPYDTTAINLIAELRHLQKNRYNLSRLRNVLRLLQRYSISLFPNIYRAMLAADIELLDSGHAILINESCYDRKLGFCPNQIGFHEPHTLIV